MIRKLPLLASVLRSVVMVSIFTERRNEMKSTLSTTRRSMVALTLAGASAMFAQAPPQGPPPAPGAYASVSGTISQLNYGPEMEVTSFLVNGNTLVTFPPHVAWALSSTLKPGENVQVAGLPGATPSGMQRIELQTLNAAGRTFAVPQPGQFTPYSGSGKITQLNYNREGEVDGFLLDNGVFAKTPPPFSATLTSMVSRGQEVSVTGYSHEAISGRTIVDVQSINGQTIAYGTPGPPPPPR
jgi:hypothetical protein